MNQINSNQSSSLAQQNTPQQATGSSMTDSSSERSANNRNIAASLLKGSALLVAGAAMGLGITGCPKEDNLSEEGSSSHVLRDIADGFTEEEEIQLAADTVESKQDADKTSTPKEATIGKKRKLPKQSAPFSKGMKSFTDLN